MAFHLTIKIDNAHTTYARLLLSKKKFDFYGEMEGHI